MNRTAAGVCLVVLLTAGAATAHAQMPARQTVISANPFGLLVDFFNAEFERAIAPTATIGIGGSTFSSEDEVWGSEITPTTYDARYVNADVFWRYYPSGEAFEGWNLGVKVGVTSISSDNPGSEDGTYLGYGFDANRSWLLGPTDRLYIGLGFGLKRLIGAKDEDLKYIPTFRIVNVGFTF